MSVPHSTILSCSRGVLAKTDVGYCSPKQSQNSSSYAENNVKVVVYPKKEDARINAPTENGLKMTSAEVLSPNGQSASTLRALGLKDRYANDLKILTSYLINTLLKINEN